MRKTYIKNGLIKNSKINEPCEELKTDRDFQQIIGKKHLNKLYAPRQRRHNGPVKNNDIHNLHTEPTNHNVREVEVQQYQSLEPSVSHNQLSLQPSHVSADRSQDQDMGMRRLSD